MASLRSLIGSRYAWLRASTWWAVAMGVACSAAVGLIGGLLTRTSLPSIAAQAFAADWFATAAGVTWSLHASHHDRRETFDLLRRIAIGTAVSAGTVALVGATAIATHRVTLERIHETDVRAHATPIAWLVAVGFAGLHAMRDELWLRGLLSRVVPPRKHIASYIILSGAASVASASSELSWAPGHAIAFIIHAFSGMMFGALWAWGRGAWAAWAAHTTWVLLAEDGSWREALEALAGVRIRSVSSHSDALLAVTGLRANQWLAVAFALAAATTLTGLIAYRRARRS